MADVSKQLRVIPPDTERAIITYASKAHELLLNQFSLRTNLEMVDRYYMRENDMTIEQIRARIANKVGDATKFQDVTVPIVMPQVEAALGYLTNVFLTGYPIFGVAADPSMEDAALQMETIIAENALTASWARELMMFFRDGLKYNLHGVECEWQQRKVANVTTDASQPNSAKVGSILWKGNVLRRMDLYNTFFDPRVHPSEIHKNGEYAGYIENYSRVRMKQMINELYGTVPVSTVERAFASAPASGGMVSSGTPFSYYLPMINPYPIMDRGNMQNFDWMSWATNATTNSKNLRYSNVYEVMRLYGRIVPADFGLKVPEENTPQVWKFIIINGQVVLFAERQGNAHGYIPIFFGQPIEDGLDFQTKSFATNVADMQDLATAMWNGFIASKRRLIGDRALFDPSKVRKQDINDTNPAAKIAVRPTAYGKPVSEAVFAFPYRDDNTNSFLAGSDAIVKMANLINGQNPAQQGQFVKGNKTKHEYDDVMGHGNDHNQIMAIGTENTVFTPLKEVIKLNILQYQPDTTLFNRDKQQQVTIKQEDLRKDAVHFKVSDGLIPGDKQIAGDVLQSAIQVIGSSPSIAQGYNVPPMFSYLMKTEGLDLSPFEKPQIQVMYEQQLAAWQQAAAEAAKAKTAFSTPMPQVPPALQQLQQQQAQPPASKTDAAAASTQGDN